MMRHIYHEEISNRGGKIILDTTEIEPGRFETTAINAGTCEELDIATQDDVHDAGSDFDAMMERFAGPLQNAFYKAGMKTGGRYSLAFLGEFGFPVCLNITLHSYRLEAWAQYDDAVTIIYTPAGKRKDRALRLYNRSFLAYDGWRTLDSSATFDVADRGGVTAMMSRYACFDERYMEDIRANWPDFIGAYRREEVPFPIPARLETAQPEREPRGPFRLADGITVVFDPQSAKDPAIDMAPEEFARLYAEDAEPMGTEGLARALKRAAIASAAHIEDEDGGTCNFDSPALDFAACGISRANAERVIKAVGLSCFDWRPYKGYRGEDGKIVKAPTYLVIGGFTSGQGDRRTSMAEAFCERMNAEGFRTQMYYQMD